MGALCQNGPIYISGPGAAGSSLFEREHHRRIATVLAAFDAELLAAHGCLFGGDTAITLRYGEYRESVDIDFLVSDRAGYRAIRQLLAADGIQGIARQGATLTPARDLWADGYGVRAAVTVDDIPIKFEIIVEGWLTLDTPSPDDKVCGVATLTPLDMAATKLLANSYRWADSATHSRDLIDLAMMSLSKALLGQALNKARAAYGDSVERNLAKAVESLREQPNRLDRHLEALAMTIPKVLLWKRIRALDPHVELLR